jgi:hypothetical protein
MPSPHDHDEAATIAGAGHSGEPLTRLGSRNDLVDIADMATWPSELKELVGEVAALTDRAESIGDLRLPEEADDLIRASLGGQSLLAFHATRLLDHERTMIKSVGLRMHGRDLFNDKIIAAFDQGFIDAGQRDALLAGHMCAGSEPRWRGKREDQVCVILGRAVFDNEPHAVRELLSSWGGEGIYFAAGTRDMKPVLKRLGVPTIVVLAIPVAPSSRQQQCWPGLAKALVGTFFGMRSHADLYHPSPVLAHNILAIWQPGDAEYDRHVPLPTS